MQPGMRQATAAVVPRAVPVVRRAAAVSVDEEDDGDAPDAANDPLGELIDELTRFEFDPYGFVLYAFPWGEPGTSLANEPGPEDWQREHLERVGDKLRAGGDLGAVVEEDTSAGHGVGKLLSDDTLVPTPSGFRRHGDLRPGDQVFGADGAPAVILQTHHYENVPMYRVTFDDRSYCDVSSGHLWSVRGRHERRTGSEEWRTLSTLDILALGVDRPNGAAAARQWEIPIQGPAQHPERALLIDPYLMGMWLGNGSQDRITQPQCQDLRAWADANGIAWAPYEDRLADLWRPGIRAALRDLGVYDHRSWEKVIPADYLIAGVEQRKALLAGLMDTDGTIGRDNGSATYDTTSEQLAHDVIALTRSLGGKAMLQETVKAPFYRDADGEKVYGRNCYRVTVRTPFNPFRRASKAQRWSPAEPRYFKRWIDSIESLPSAPHGQCISVDRPDGLYLANDYIVTHNSACVAWVILWAISTRALTRGVVTANTEPQLRTKTWAELGKWHELFIARELFRFTATAIYSANKTHEKTWRIDALPWNASKTEAFAGLHNKGGRVLVLFDEASAIDDPIWDVTEGALTDANTQIVWCRYGNPTRTSGRFHKNCTRPRRNTYTRVDGRSVRFTNKAQIQAWAEEYGDDSDFFRVRVKGQFPRAGTSNFISPELTEAARRREMPRQAWEAYPKILSCDPARFGDDWTIITLRQGLRVHWQQGLMGFDGVDVGGRIAELCRQVGNILCIAYDAVGNGADLDSTLRRIQGLPQLVPVMWGVPAKDSKQYFNQRAEAWGTMRDWLKAGMIPDDDELCEQLTSLDYGYDNAYRIQLESKADAKKRGVKSPDKADSLAISFVPDLVRTETPNAKVRAVQKRQVVWSRTR
jgi:hypothetical protein